MPKALYQLQQDEIPSLGDTSMGGIRLSVMILLLFLLIYPSAARMGYDVVASAGGPTFEIHHSTKYMSFSLDSVVRGTGNFSRLNSITDITGVSAKEATSSTKNGSLNYTEQTRLVTKEGPVLVTASLKSYDLSDEDEDDTSLRFVDSAVINVEENWPTSFANLKKIAYAGAKIRTRERYENNGDVVATSIDSWRLSKQSIYRATRNRTIIFASINPEEATIDVATNKTSAYALGLQTTGELTNLNVIERSPSGGIASQVTQDYRGSQKMTLAIKMNSILLKPPTNDTWLECCPTGSMYERLLSNRSF
jgi:hypothetical protein